MFLLLALAARLHRTKPQPQKELQKLLLAGPVEQSGEVSPARV
jgi:hypothetical protein